ncbi:MAG: hypothetical protein NTNFB02_26880 [Nitrospira sp.]
MNVSVMIGPDMMLHLSKSIRVLAAASLLTACGEPVFENAGSPNSLALDREACVMEIDQSPEAFRYRQNPAAHPDYPVEAVEDINTCIEKKGWRLVRSRSEQEQVRDAVASEMSRSPHPVPLSDPKGIEALKRAIEDKLTRAGSVESTSKKE